MTVLRLLIQSIGYYWRTNLAVLLGVVAGTAVIGGALIVGDSVRGSLRQMTEERLGEIDHVLNSPRFFRQELADDLAAHPEFAARFETAAPALVMTGALEYKLPAPGTADAAPAGLLRAGKVNVFGVDASLWNMTRHGSVPPPGEGEIILNHRVAQQLRKRDEEGRIQRNQQGEPLGVKPGDTVSLWVEIPSSIPRDSLLGKRDTTTREIPLKVKALLDEGSGVGRLNLNPNQQLPASAFVALPSLQRELELNRTVDRVTREVTPARVNALFVRAKSPADGEGENATAAAEQLTGWLAQCWTLADLQLRVAVNAEHEYLSLESDQQMLADPFASAGRQAAETLKWKSSPVLVYLANEIAPAAGDDSHFSRYSIVAGLDMTDAPGFDAFTYTAGGPPNSDDEIVLDSWLADDLDVQVGEAVKLWYYEVGNYGDLPEQERAFQLAGIVEMTGSAVDGGLTPRVKGITDVETHDDWNAPFPMKPVTDRDEEFWNQYRATPKAFVTLPAAQSLWRSRYGQLTSIRVSPPEAESRQQSVDVFAREVLGSVDPREIGMAFDAVKRRQLQAASGTTDFAGLFIGFSFFLIAAAAILIGLLFRLGIERRSTNVGLLGAVGFGPRRVSRMFLTEGLLVVGVGAAVGIIAAYAYASLMVYGLKTWWIGAIGTRFLSVHVQPLSLVYGFVGSVLVAAIAIWWAMRQLRQMSSRELLAGATEPSLSGAARGRRSRIARTVTAICGGLAVLLLACALAGFVPAQEAFSGFSWQVVAFFLVGVLLLTASLTFLSAWLDSDRAAAVHGGGMLGMGRLGLRNAARHRQRSVLTTGLIASATFVIVAIAAGHRNPAVEKPDKSSGNGGYTLVAETSQPIYENLNDPADRYKRNLHFDESAGDEADQQRAKRNNALLQEMNVMPFRVKPGENASCLNIYQTHLPTVLGVPQRMIERGGFKFSGADRDNPWTLLNEKHADEKSKDGNRTVPVYPVIGDMNTLQYSLHKGVGSKIALPDEDNPDYMLAIVGQFDGSVFQGVLLMSAENFQRLYPERTGYEYFLIEVPPADADDLSSILESGLNDVGFDAERVAHRLDDFLAVQNTYLSTFQTLGGLGLLLGTLGLATVMLRNVLERRAELALLRAVGFPGRNLAWLVLWENAFLLSWGLLSGTASALLAMTPHLRSIGADVPWTSVELILAGVFTVGMLAAFLAVREAVRTPILATLRSE